MKPTINIIRILVGILFIFSGLVKANDPLGTAYKMQEYFEVWSADLGTSSFFLKNALLSLFHFLNDHTLLLSVVMNAFEIIAGAALLLGWRMKLFSWLLLLLMIFFTILTGYTYKTGRPTNCGCFGDCIKITPEYSFYKDVLLSILILIILFARRYIKSVFRPAAGTSLMILTTIFSFGLQWYASKYLPPVDCLPFKKGNNISEKMKLPANAIPDSTVITFVYEKAGKKVEFTADKFPDDFNANDYKFISRYDKVLKKGKNNVAPIKGFALKGAGDEDLTQTVLSQPNTVLLFCENFSSNDPIPTVPLSKWKDKFSKIYATAKEKDIPVYLITKQPDEAVKAIASTDFKDIPILKCDYTPIRTAARTNPCIYLLNEGTVIGKWSYHGANEVVKKLQTLVVPQKAKEVITDSLPPPTDTSKIK